jgi:Fur family peroxide stress response transcriptional regulator
VLEFLFANAVHATAEEIYRSVNLLDPRASRATVYNNLKSLMQAGLVREVAGDGKAARFDANLRRHHHFVCEQCGAIEDVPWFGLEGTGADELLGDRRMRTFEVVFRGLCRCCTNSDSKAGERL